MAIEKVIGALTTVGKWVMANPLLTLDAVDKVAKIQTEKKPSTKEQLETIEERLNQVGAAALELDQKFTGEVGNIRNQLRTMKIILSVMGALLGASIIAIIILAFLN